MPSNNDNVFNFEWEGFEEFRDLIDGLEDEFYKIAKEEYTKYGMLLEEGTKALAPVDEGNLEDSINFITKREGNSIVIEGGSNLEYALRRHEEPYRMGKHPKYDNGSKFPDYYKDGRGRETRAKGTWRGMQSGRKFLTNAVILTEEDWNTMNRRIIQRLFGGGDG